MFPDLDPSELDQNWVKEFNRNLIDEGLHPNTIWKHHKNFKTFITQMIRDGVIKKDPYIGFDNKQFNRTKPWVLDEEIELLESYHPKDEALAYCKDFFMISYLSLLRFSDVRRIKQFHLQEMKNGKFLKITTLKTGEPVVIPVGKKLDKLLNSFVPMEYGNDRINNNLKILFENAGLVRQVESLVITSNRNGVKKEFKSIPLYKSVTIHMARRSGITSLILSGVRPIDIMPITGHHTERALMQYIGINSQQAADKLSNHKFFK